MTKPVPKDELFMARALRLACRAAGRTSPNPIVGAVIVRNGIAISEGYHHAAGQPHAEIEAIRNAGGKSLKGTTLYVTLEPCSTFGRTPPCTDAIISSGIKKVVVGAVDPNPKHAGRGLKLLAEAGVGVKSGVLGERCREVNEVFNHWIVRKRPFVIVKSAMTLDGKIATPSGESKWITGPESRRFAMQIRARMDAILVGVNTILQDDPSLTVRSRSGRVVKPLRRIILDSRARTPLTSKVVTDDQASMTTVVVTDKAPANRVKALKSIVNVIECQKSADGQVNLGFLLDKLGSEQVSSLLVEGGGEVNASFLLQHLAQRVMFFYAPMILGGADSRKAVAGRGVDSLESALRLEDVHWRKLGVDLLMTARVKPGSK